MNNSGFKKILNFLLNIILKIASVISFLIDKLIYSKKYSIILSFLIAILLFMTISVQNNQLISLRYNYEKRDMKLQVKYNQELYDVSGAPETINVSASGSREGIQSLENSKEIGVVLDLSGFGEGNYTVPIGLIGFPPSLSIYMSPEKVNVNISRKISRQFQLQYDFINLDKLDSRFIPSIVNPTLSLVEIKGSSAKLDQVASVKALVDVNGKKDSFSSEVEIVVYDQAGQKMEGVSVLPNKVMVEVEIVAPSRQVPIKVYPVGEILNNKMIDHIQMDNNMVTIFGPKDVLQSTNSVDVYLNSSTLINDQTSVKYSLSKPANIKALDLENVSLVVYLADKKEKTINNVQVLLVNNDNHYKVETLDHKPLLADIRLVGTATTLKDVELRDVSVYLDMSNLKLGKNKIKLEIKGDNPLLEYHLVNAEMEVNVVK